MKSRHLNTTTALVASLSLIAPHATFAQQASDISGIEVFCETSEDAQTCVQLVEQAIENGTIVLNEDGSVSDTVSISNGALVIDGEAAPETTSETTEANTQSEDQAETAATSDATETEDDIQGDADTAENAEQQITNPEAEPSTTHDTVAATENGDASVSDAGDVNVEVEASGTEVEAQSTEDAPTNTETADQETEEVAAEPGDVEQVEEETQPVEDEQPEEVVQTDTADSTDAANTATAVEATQEQADDESASVEVETVEEAEVRSSTEDFDTKVNSNTESTPQKGGLSNIEKLLVGAAGAAIVGAILKNGDKVVSNSGDRIVVQRDDGGLQVLKDDDLLLRRPGSEVRTQTFNDGSTRTTVIKPNGTQVVTIRSASGQVLQRTRILTDGQEVVLFDDTQEVAPVIVSELPTMAPRADQSDIDNLRQALAAREIANNSRRFSLQQIRQIRAVRELAPEIELQAVNFDTGSAAIRATEAEELSELGTTIRELIAENPNEVFLIEGHTDAVGNAGYNLALSDRRAESVALALTEYFDVPPENMVVQGFGEANLKVLTSEAERQNRRAAVRRITNLLQTADLK